MLSGRSQLRELRSAASAAKRVCDSCATGTVGHMSEARTPEEETIESELSRIPDEDVPVDDEYDGPDPEDDPKGDASDEDQGT